MGTTSPKPQLAPEQIRRAADYVELVWQEQGSEAEKAALKAGHALRVPSSVQGRRPVPYAAV
ncbi:hypothetical protein [Streptomyces sp. DH12]|uniref:hypothetical protein n=1 Tax=Streptomyces sp. DH12 TaxID=2857010 RepID=UPI001E3F97F7|nr:hypothetical protein [Streptomyces sp. DH12]